MSFFRIGFSKVSKNTFIVNYLHNYLKKAEGKFLICGRSISKNFAHDGWAFINLSSSEYNRVCSETLNGLFEYFEEIVESAEELESTDVAYNDGVLTVNLGNNGIYVINRQAPNKQVWLSSPITGPKRYDFYGADNAKIGKWIYKHTGESMHNLLQNEIKSILQRDVNFLQLPYAGQ